MLAKKIKFVDFDGNEREETYYFNLSKSELVEMELGEDGGLSNMLERVMETKHVPTIAKLFKKIILASYGEKSADGKRLRKSEELAEAFSQTGAYDELYMELIQSPEKAAAFCNAIVPKAETSPVPYPANK